MCVGKGGAAAAAAATPALFCLPACLCHPAFSKLELCALCCRAACPGPALQAYPSQAHPPTVASCLLRIIVADHAALLFLLGTAMPQGLLADAAAQLLFLATLSQQTSMLCYSRVRAVSRQLSRQHSCQLALEAGMVVLHGHTGSFCLLACLLHMHTVQTCPAACRTMPLRSAALPAAACRLALPLPLPLQYVVVSLKTSSWWNFLSKKQVGACLQCRGKVPAF
jgi:hypothetical protein